MLLSLCTALPRVLGRLPASTHPHKTILQELTHLPQSHPPKRESAMTQASSAVCFSWWLFLGLATGFQPSEQNWCCRNKPPRELCRRRAPHPQPWSTQGCHWAQLLTWYKLQPPCPARPSLESHGTNMRVPQKSVTGATAELLGGPLLLGLLPPWIPYPQDTGFPQDWHSHSWPGARLWAQLLPANAGSYLPSSIYQALSRADLIQVLGTQKQEDIVTALQGACDPMT